MNTYLTKAALVTRGRSLILSSKIKEMDQNITQKTTEIYELLQNNSNLGLLNQNIAKNVEDLQKKKTSINFSLSNLMDEYAVLKKCILEVAEQNTNFTQSTQVTQKEILALSLKIKEIDQNTTHKSNEIFELQQV
ncbi:UNVERIFIED_CONTAM: hypothetical protein B566_EDAN018876, partial [Ephemera danica]